MAEAFDASKEPLRALRDLFVLIEANVLLHSGEYEILDRARVGFDTLRALFGDDRPAADVASRERMIEPALVPEIGNANLDGALRLIVAKEGYDAALAALRRCGATGS